jgi:hypothetical protein
LAGIARSGHALLLLGGLRTVPPHILQTPRDGAVRFRDHEHSAQSSMVICSDFGRLGEGCASERLSNEKWQGCDTGVRYANGWRNTSPCTSVSEEAGKPEGRGHKFWYQAERELQHNETQPNQPKGAVG